MRTYKDYVKNPKRVEGSIANRYILVEVILYCMEYIPNGRKGTHKCGRPTFMDDDVDKEQPLDKGNVIHLETLKYEQVRHWVLSSYDAIEEWEKKYNIYLRDYMRVSRHRECTNLGKPLDYILCLREQDDITITIDAKPSEQLPISAWGLHEHSTTSGGDWPVVPDRFKDTVWQIICMEVDPTTARSDSFSVGHTRSNGTFPTALVAEKMLVQNVSVDSNTVPRSSYSGDSGDQHWICPRSTAYERWLNDPTWDPTKNRSTLEEVGVLVDRRLAHVDVGKESDILRSLYFKDPDIKAVSTCSDLLTKLAKMIQLARRYCFPVEALKRILAFLYSIGRAGGVCLYWWGVSLRLLGHDLLSQAVLYGSPYLPANRGTSSSFSNALAQVPSGGYLVDEEGFDFMMIAVKENIVKNPQSKYLDVDHDPLAHVFGKVKKGCVNFMGLDVTKKFIQSIELLRAQIMEGKESYIDLENRFLQYKAENDAKLDSLRDMVTSLRSFERAATPTANVDRSRMSTPLLRKEAIAHFLNLHEYIVTSGRPLVILGYQESEEADMRLLLI
ncbi:hypothetical protein GIB67_024177 [Kingdonia uniflora]|uniref:Uncharacterized protein n=1 Tax=Kingdonia uniflora TaxID=39325 RepID=A0A7J7LZI7_9MAGN|nr:hypothetical protein GIB67_024177 [Kingdonia uniflora]